MNPDDQIVMARLETLEDLKRAMEVDGNFSFYAVLTRDELALLHVDPPAICYVQEDGSYYMKFKYHLEFEDTPFYSSINDWHNMACPSPLFDRKIHHVHTRWLNNWDLDWYPDYIDTTQGGQDIDDLHMNFGYYYNAPEGQNTEITNMQPSDLIFRSQTWRGTINGDHPAGVDMIEILGIDEEIADKWGSSHNIVYVIKTQGIPGAQMFLDNTVLHIVDHEPNARSIHGYNCGSPSSPCWDGTFAPSIWKPCNLPTTKVILKYPTAVPLTHGQEFEIRLRHWYAVSVEHLGSKEDKTDWELPEFCDGHHRITQDFFHIDYGQVPARYEAMLHTIGSEEDLLELLGRKQIVPGDLLHHETLKNWIQVLPQYDDFGIMTDESIAFADFSRTLTVFDKEEFGILRQHFDLHTTYVLNWSHEQQYHVPELKIGFDQDGYIITRRSNLLPYRPADFIYFKD